GSPGTPGLPCTMVLTAFFVLSPETGLCCLSHRWNLFRRFSASVGAPKPHDSAVRSHAVRLSIAKTSTASRPTFVTMANAPLFGRDRRSFRIDLPDGLSEIFLQKRLDRQSKSVVPMAGEIAVVLVAVRSPPTELAAG